MLRKISVFLLAALPLLALSLGTSVSAAQPTITSVPGCNPPFLGPERHSLWVSTCGPSRVIQNRNYTYGVVVKNYGKRTFRKLKLSVFHFDPLTRSSRPYRRELRRDDPFRIYAAVWTLNNFKPSQLFRVNITLPFKLHDVNQGSGLTGTYFDIEARGYSPHEIVGHTKRVAFIRK